MRAKEYPLLCQAVETGVKLGWNRAHKHDAEPPDDQIMEAIVTAILNEICEAFDFDDVPREG
jgi:hypothetical protein